MQPIDDKPNPFDDLPTLETPRLLLRQLTFGDAQDVYAYASDPEVTKYVFWDCHNSIEESKAFLNRVIQKYRNKDVAEWGLELKESGKLIGTCGFCWWRPEHARAEIGYALAREHWGQGLMTEAARAAIEFGFDRVNLNRIEARCFPENTGSERIMQKVGMVYEGTFREQMLVKGTFIDLKMYSILKREHNQSNAAR